jgi:hypothetical protein
MLRPCRQRAFSRVAPSYRDGKEIPADPAPPAGGIALKKRGGAISQTCAAVNPKNASEQGGRIVVHPPCASETGKTRFAGFRRAAGNTPFAG